MLAVGSDQLYSDKDPKIDAGCLVSSSNITAPAHDLLSILSAGLCEAILDQSQGRGRRELYVLACDTVACGGREAFSTSTANATVLNERSAVTCAQCLLVIFEKSDPPPQSLQTLAIELLYRLVCEAATTRPMAVPLSSEYILI